MSPIPKRKCVVCLMRPAVVPDRNRMGRPFPQVCRECHADRLREDLVVIIQEDEKRKAKEGLSNETET